MKYECDCGARYNTVEGVRGCQAANHGVPRKDLPDYALSETEQQSGVDRIAAAEQLILQLPYDHDGRNTWLANYGRSSEASVLRRIYRLSWDDTTKSAKSFKGNSK